MTHSVFVSYARSASAAEARALAERLGDLAFLDTSAVDDGDGFPARLNDGLLSARVVVVFASGAYAERRFCRLEMRLALAAGDAEASHLVVARGEGADAVLDALPPSVAGRSWPAAEETERLAELVQLRLAVCGAPLSETVPEDEARRIAKAFLEESYIPEPLDRRGISCSLPPGVAGQSIGGQFVGRAADLRALHSILFDGGAGRAARY